MPTELLGPGNASSPQNSPLRRLTAGIVEGTARKVHKLAPNLTPDQVSEAGAKLVIAGSVMGGLAETRKQKVIAASVKGAGNLLDAFDGALHRVIEKEEKQLIAAGRKPKPPVPEDPTAPNPGVVTDFRFDRISEGVSAVEVVFTAAKNGNWKGVLAGLAAGKTQSLTSKERARAERLGKEVPELGKKGAIGTRVGRAVIASLNTAVPEAQPYLDAVSTVSNITTSEQRRRIANDPTVDPVYGEKVKREAEERLKVADPLASTFDSMQLAAAFGGTVVYLGKKYVQKHTKQAA